MNRKILRLAIPSIAANITTPLLALVDTAIVGHLGSEVYIAAIAIGGVMFNMIYWLFSFLRGGTSGIAAQAYGAGDTKATTLVLRRSLILAVMIGILIILLQYPLYLLLSDLLQPDPVTETLSAQYFSILIFGAPAVLGNFALSGWFLGMQVSRMLLWVSLIINLVNIASSLILVYLLDMGIPGVATGTLIAQWTGFCAGFLFLRRFRQVSVTIAEILHLDQLKRFFRVNIDVMLRTICLIAVTMWFTRTGAQQGTLILAVNTLLMQLFILFSYMMDGFAFAGEALVGRFVGDRDYRSMKLCVRQLFMWGILWAALFTTLYFVGGEGFLRLLSDDGDVITASHEYYLWAVTVPFAGFAAFAWDGVFIGATMTRGLVISMAGAMTVFFVTYLISFQSMGNHGLWLAFILYLLTRGLLQTVIFMRHTPGSTSVAN
ncbi:MAG: MATE family efflux transporter [Muribaculaceae bacterium]|nr:MATE family efflux transporter [Muribaculaceae bacterium]